MTEKAKTFAKENFCKRKGSSFGDNCRDR
uniref:Uncharacterized protein n=1 Tax=Rhizophora mucronata TaxID=61149 RepID=A0A2P2PCD8_RHIMU